MGNDGYVAIVLAAGQGTRMKSPLPKVLHEVAGRPMVSWAVGVALEAGAERVVAVLGHGKDEVEAALVERFGSKVSTVVQHEQNGTGDAVRVGMSALEGFEGRVLILYGDCPLIPVAVLESLMAASHVDGMKLALVTASLNDPSGYGRILRGPKGSVTAIREQRDCTPEELAVNEVNPGLYAVEASFLREALADLSTDNAQGEIYLTDVIAAAAESDSVADVAASMRDLLGVNDRLHLAEADRRMRRRICEALAKAGVGIRDPEQTFIDADCVVEPDASVEAGVHLRGRCHVHSGARVDVGCVLENVIVEAGAHIKPYTVATDSEIGASAQVGPFSHLRPGSLLGAKTKVGNFVETKKTTLGEGSKVSHLSYVGDGVLGKNVNVGAGTIFCNYDGIQKNTTILEDGVFIGSDSQLIAPLTVGAGAYVASGTTVTKDVPADALALSRTKQQNKLGYASRLRARFEAEKKAKKS